MNFFSNIEAQEAVDRVLKDWRSWLIHSVLIVLAILMLPNLITIIIADAIPDPANRPAAIFYSIVYLFVIGLIVYKKLDYRIRGWGLFIFVYAVGVVSLARGGLVGVGRDYLIVLPILGIILMGVRAGLALTGLTVVTLTVFAFLADAGSLNEILIYTNNPVSLRDWTVEGVYILSVLFFIVTIFLMFYQFQLRTLASERRSTEALTRAHEELTRMNEGLGIMVNERTDQLRSALVEAEKARKDAEEADRTRTDFFTNISHEIRTPMNGLVGVVGLLSSTSLDDKQREYVDVIQTSSDSLLTIINDLLDVSRIETGKIALENQEFNLVECIEDLIEIWGVKASEKRLELLYRIDRNVPIHLNGDRTRLNQILGNLIHNAIKFSDSGTVSLRVSCYSDSQRVENHSHSDDEKQWFTFFVEDTGTGIEPQKIGRLFSAFSQGDISTRRKQDGTGLGLMICRQLCALMGGAIRVESEGVPGRGSKFIVEIPFGHEKNGLYEDYLREIGFAIESKRLLWVTPSQKLIENIQHLQSILGVEIDCVADIEQAAPALLEKSEYDLMIIDQGKEDKQPGQFVRQNHVMIFGQTKKVLLCWPRAQLNLDTISQFSKIIEKPIRWSRLIHNFCSLLVPAHGDEHADHGEQEDQAAQSFSTEHPLDLLVVEDNPVNRQVIRLILERLGYAASYANNGQTAIEMAGKKNFDVILMDVEMPDMDGIEAAGRIRAMVSQDTRPYIILVTAHPQETLEGSLHQIKINRVVSKPVRLDSVKEALIGAHHWLMKDPNMNEEGEEVSDHSGVEELTETAEEPIKSAIDTRLFKEYWDPRYTTNEDLRNIVGLFLNESKMLITQLEAEFAQQNYAVTRRLVHSLRGAAISFGANQFAEVCQYFETRTDLDMQASGELILNRLFDEYQRLIKALHEILT